MWRSAPSLVAVGATLGGLELSRRRRDAAAAAAPQSLWCWGRCVPSSTSSTDSSAAATTTAGAAATTLNNGGDVADVAQASNMRSRKRSPVDVRFWSEQGRGVIAMSFGVAHGAALDDAGELWAWNVEDREPIKLAAAPSRWLGLARGRYTSLACSGNGLYAVTSSGALLHWSSVAVPDAAPTRACSTAAASGTPAPPSPVRLGGALAAVSATAVAASESHVLVTAKDGALFAFGANERGQLGIGIGSEGSQEGGTSDSVGGSGGCVEKLAAEEAARVALPAGARVVGAACGHGHSVAVLDDGSAFAWGDDRHLQLGLRDDSIKALRRGATHASRPAAVSGPWLADGRDGRVRAVAAGGGGTEGGHTAFLVETTRGDELYTCGYGRWGALGARAFSHIAGLRPVTTLASLREYDEALGRVVPLRILGVACGDAHTAAVLSSGNVFTWGWNDGGQLGDGGKAATHTPVMLKAPAEFRLSRFAHVACGPASTAAWS